MTKTNAERASRAEAALLAYIDHTNDSRNANEVETWIGDLLCDLRHFCKFMRIPFYPHAGEMNFETECKEDERGHFEPAYAWTKLTKDRGSKVRGPQNKKPRDTAGSALGVILRRAGKLAKAAGREDTFSLNRFKIVLVAAHSHRPLHLTRLAKAKDFDFAHDAFGIYDKWNPKTQTYDNNWTPRHQAHG